MTRSRKEREEETRKEHILNAAERLFARSGLHDTSVADIAKEAEFGVGTLYKYFKDKNTLVQSLLDTRMAEHFDSLDDILAREGEPVEIIDAAIEGYLSSVQRLRLFFHIYFTHFHPAAVEGYCGYSDALDHSMIQERKKRLMAQMAEVFQRGIDARVFADVDSRYLASALFGMFLSFSFMQQGNSKEEWDTEGMKHAMKRILFDAVVIPRGTGVMGFVKADPDGD